MADLITLAEYKAATNILGAAQDISINALLPRVSKLVRSVCRRSFNDWVSADKTETHNGGFDRIILEEYPVISISSVTYTTDYGTTSTTLVSGTDYILDKKTSEIVALNLNKQFPMYINGYTVTYRAGYATIPEDLKLAVIDLVTYYLKNDGAVHSARNVGANTVQIEYITNVNLPAHIKRILDLYTANYN